MRHATDPDHVVAITTIVTRQRGIGKAGLIGALWGLGHTFTIFVVGTMIILFQVTIPPRIGLSMEFAVAAMLILLGILNLTGTLRQVQEKFLPNFLGQNGSTISTSARFRARKGNALSAPPAATTASVNEGLGGMFRRMGAFNVLRPLIIGIVHGLAGSAAVALLVMATIRDPWWAIAYLLLFGMGTVAGMILITTLIATPFTFTGSRFSGLDRGMGVLSGLISVGFGIFLSYQIGIVDGLFTNHVHWTPQ